MLPGRGCSETMKCGVIPPLYQLRYQFSNDRAGLRGHQSSFRRPVCCWCAAGSCISSLAESPIPMHGGGDSPETTHEILHTQIV